MNIVGRKCTTEGEGGALLSDLLDVHSTSPSSGSSHQPRVKLTGVDVGVGRAW